MNTIIAILLAAGIGGALSTRVSTIAASTGGGAFFGVSLLAIYLRGYLVPGTPELTKRYMPPWLLAVFGKEPDDPADVETDVDPEETLLAAGALEECEQIDDLCLTEGFRESWYAEIDQIKTEERKRDRLLDLLGSADGEVTFEEYGEAFKARIDGRAVGRWESEAAFVADLGAARVLERRLRNWAELPVQSRSQLLNSLRLFIDTCPSCGGSLDFETDTVRSCCSTQEVVAVACDGCDARLFESPVER